MTDGERAGEVRRLGAVATLVWDRILNPFAEAALTREQWGGAVYSYSSLAASCPEGWEAVPIVKIGADLETQGRALIDALPNLNPGPGVRGVAAPNNRVELRYHDAGNRTEIQTGGVPPWRWEELEPLLDGLDALYLNYLSGQELDLETTLRVRDRFRGPIYADLHSLFLTPPGDHPRRPRPLADREGWLSCFDAIQLNEVELGLLADGDDPEEFALSIPEHGPGLVMVTLGERGVRYVVREGFPDHPLRWSEAHGTSGPVRQATVPPPTGKEAGDPTGCGDVWGAAFFAGLLGGLALEDAVARAERMAAAKIRHPDTSRLLHHLRRELAAEGAG